MNFTAKSKIVFQNDKTIIVSNEIEPMGVTHYYLFDESLWGTLAFNSIKSALKFVKDNEGNE